MSFHICRTGVAAMVAVAGVVNVVAEQSKVAELPPVVVTATPLSNPIVDLAQPATVLTEQKLQERLAPTLGETLAEEPGISQTYYGPNASRPVIRGLDGDHIRILQNGVGMMDVSAASVDHAVSQDPLTVTKIEVVRGPAALLYGPTAVGGVVNVLDNRIPDERIETPLTGRLEGRHTSVDTGGSGAGVVEGGTAGFNYHLDGFARGNADLRIPGWARSARLRAIDPLPVEPRDRLPNSQAHSAGGAGGLSYVGEIGYIGGSFQGLDNDYGTVAEEEVSIQLRQRRWDLGGALTEPADWLPAVKWKFASSDYEHTEYEGAVAGTLFALDGLNGRLEVVHPPVGLLTGAVGYEARRDKLDIAGDEAFMPPTDSLMNSIFLFEEVQWDKVRLQFGGRYDGSEIEAPAQAQRFQTGSGAAGVVVRPDEEYSTALNFAYTQRAPVNQELFANGPHLATAAFEVGDPTLRPEKSLGVDLTLRRETGRVTGAVTFFYIHFEDFIALQPTGATDLDSGLPIYHFAGIPAEFLGGEAAVLFHLTDAGPHRLHLELKSDYTRATNLDTGAALPRIPPWRLGAELSYEWSQRLRTSLQVQRAQSQHRVAPNELPTDGYTMLNLIAAYRLATGPVTWDVLAKGTNLLDEEARVSTSFLKDIAPLAGRGVLVALQASF